MALSPTSYYDVGTVSVAAGGTAVTGAGTSWSGIVQGGDMLMLAGLMVMVQDVASSTSLTLLQPWPGAAQADSTYAVSLTSPDRLAVTAIPTALRGLIEQTRILSGRVETYAVVARQDAPPVAPVTDDMYLIGLAPSGAWAGRADYIAQWSGTGWVYISPKSGMRAYSRAVDVLYQRGATAWTAVPATFAAVAASGAYSDLTGRPVLGTMAAQAASAYMPLLASGAALPTSNIGPIWHDDYASMLTWRSIGAYTGYASVNVGEVAMFWAAAAPKGWLKLNGATLTAAYAALAATVGPTLGDARGYFLRGSDDGRGVDAGRTTGSVQADGIKSHTHTWSSGWGANYPNGQAVNYGSFAVGSATNNGMLFTGTNTSTGGAETRPVNIAALACIKF